MELGEFMLKPRLSISKKWTAFPKDILVQMEQAFNEAFPGRFDEAKLILDGRIYPTEILLRVGYLEQGRLTQNNFEVSVEYSRGQDDAVDGIHKVVDAAASMMNEYFESEGEVDFPREWKNFDFDGRILWARYSTENTELESEADRLLGLADDSLVREEQESEDALERTDEVISSHEDDEPEDFDEADDDEDSRPDTSQPSIFSGRNKKKKEHLH